MPLEDQFRRARQCLCREVGAQIDREVRGDECINVRVTGHIVLFTLSMSFAQKVARWAELPSLDKAITYLADKQPRSGDRA